MASTAMKSLLFLALLTLSPLAVFAQSTAASATLAPRLAEADKKFIKDFVEQHLLEQELVNKARGKEMGAVRDQKPSPLAPAVSALYKKLHSELTSSWTELATLSQSKKVEITTTAKPADLAAAAAVGKLPADKFDKEFVKTIAKEAKKTDTLLANAGKSVRDPEVKAFVDKWGPTFKAHLGEVDTAEKALKAK
jgi:predicted outer membrane protein